MTSESECPFCNESGAIASNELALARYDRYPASPGHTLVMPRRHFADLFDATAEERDALWRLLEEVKGELERERRPAGYNIGVNVGRAAGQAVMHLHIHVIPRYPGDTEGAADGVRAAVPGEQHR